MFDLSVKRDPFISTNIGTRRQAYIMNDKNDSTEKDLTRAIHNKQEHRGKDIKIFCVGNELYGNPPHRLADEYRNLSGVRELRSYCRSVPAEARMKSALVFIRDQVPALLRSIEQWTLTGRDSVTSEKARKLRSVLEQLEGDLREVYYLEFPVLQVGVFKGQWHSNYG
jgi:hypothetical protein